MEAGKTNRYAALIECIFLDRYKKGAIEIGFCREDLEVAAAKLGIKLPKNLGDVIYSVRYRAKLPPAIINTQPFGKEWTIEGRGKAQYAFCLSTISQIVPNAQLEVIKILDSTPEIVCAYALSDEQALLAKVRYNRLVDIFLGVAAYSLQNHLRTTVPAVGQVEIDEIYVAVDQRGRQYVLPVQAKGGNDHLSVVQTKQDIACCRAKYPNLICRAIAAQFISDELIALFELGETDTGICIKEERHYNLVTAEMISPEELAGYNA